MDVFIRFAFSLCLRNIYCHLIESPFSIAIINLYFEHAAHYAEVHMLHMHYADTCCMEKTCFRNICSIVREYRTCILMQHAYTLMHIKLPLLLHSLFMQLICTFSSYTAFALRQPVDVTYFRKVPEIYTFCIVLFCI